MGILDDWSENVNVDIKKQIQSWELPKEEKSIYPRWEIVNLWRMFS
jgi:hypothetical protein